MLMYVHIGRTVTFTLHHKWGGGHLSLIVPHLSGWGIAFSAPPPGSAAYEADNANSADALLTYTTSAYIAYFLQYHTYYR